MDASTTITNAITTSDYPALSNFFINTHPTLNAGEQRSASAHFIVRAVNSTFFPEAFKSEVIRDVIQTSLSNIPAVVEGAADNKLRHLLFDFHVEEGNYAEAARILAGMRMEDTEGSVYFMKPLEKCDVYVKVAECYLEEEMNIEAEGAVGKAGSVIEANNISFPSKDGEEENDSPKMAVSSEEQEGIITLLLRYKSTHARVLDANRKFLQAAMKYYDLSTAYLHTDKIDTDDLMIMLGKAVTCAILSPNSAQRQRVLGIVYNDERLNQLDLTADFQSHSSILTKMYLNRVVQKQELEKFESSLADHQKAIMADGLTIVERGVLEHNMVAVSHLYTSIYFEQLAQLLGVVDAVKGEKVAAKMISDGSLSGEIDEVEGVLRFFHKSGAAAGSSDGNQSNLVGWDETITQFCIQLNKVTDAVRAV